MTLNEYLTPSLPCQWKKVTIQEQTRLGLLLSSARPVLTGRKPTMVKGYQIVKIKSTVEFLPHVRGIMLQGTIEEDHTVPSHGE